MELETLRRIHAILNGFPVVIVSLLLVAELSSVTLAKEPHEAVATWLWPFLIFSLGLTYFSGWFLGNLETAVSASISDQRRMMLERHYTFSRLAFYSFVLPAAFRVARFFSIKESKLMAGLYRVSLFTSAILLYLAAFFGGDLALQA